MRARVGLRQGDTDLDPLMLSLRPTTSRLQAKLRAPRRFAWQGFTSEELYPRTVLDRSPALALPDEFERISGAIDGCDLREWIEEARGGEQVQPPTRRYCLGRALIADGTVYFRGGYEVLRSGNAKPIAFGRALQIDEAQLAAISVTEEYFGHWLVDGQLMILLAAEAGVPALAPWTTASREWGHRVGYAAITNLPCLEPRLADVGRLWAVDDKPRNAGRAARLHHLRARTRQAASRTGGERVVLRRGITGKLRHLVNEDALCELLASRYGYSIVDPTRLSASAIIEALAQARVVLGVEGSHMFHAIVAAAERALLFMIMPPDRFSPALKWYTDMIGMQFGFTVAERSGTGFSLPEARVHAVAELIEAQLGRP